MPVLRDSGLFVSYSIRTRPTVKGVSELVILATCTSYPVFGSSDVNWNTLKFEPLISACRKMPLGVYHFVIALQIFEESLGCRLRNMLPFGAFDDGSSRVRANKLRPIFLQQRRTGEDPPI